MTASPSTISGLSHSDAPYEDNAITLRLPSPNPVYSQQEFWDFCQLNPDLRAELNSDGSILIMTPVGSDGSRLNFNLATLLGIWRLQDGTGVAFDSSFGFTLPNGAVRSPDASWIKKDRWDALREEDQKKFAPIVPDFVIELKSPSDSLRKLRAKMQEYVEAGVKLGWLIDPKTRSVEIYRPHCEVQRIENAKTVSGDPELNGFVMDLASVW
jgi:Uma2 family endonuclease